jgi:vacuolar-type H+-ATPase subunit E/Vma4
MCLLCIEIVKEKLQPIEFWNNYRELKFTQEHEQELEKIISKTSAEYQQKLFEAMPTYIKEIEVNYE